MRSLVDGLRYTKTAISTPLGFQTITSLTTSTALTVPSGASMALIQCETVSIRWRDDGTDPTASVGMSLTPGSTLVYTADLSALRLIETSVGSMINVSYYK